MYEFALHPLLDGRCSLPFLICAVLEGYLTGGWKGVPTVRCLLLFGLGINENVGQTGEDDSDALRICNKRHRDDGVEQPGWLKRICPS